MAAGMAMGLNIVYTPAGLAPEINLHSTTLLDISLPDSLDELYAVRDRLHSTLGDLPAVAVSSVSTHAFAQPTADWRILHTYNIRIQIEETAQRHWDNALKLARQAVALGKRPRLTKDILEQSHNFWQAAITQLEQIPPDSFLADDAA